MHSIFNRLKKHFILSEPDTFKPRWELSELLAPSVTTSDHIDKKLSHAKTMLQTALSTTNSKEFRTAIAQAKADLSSVIPYEKELVFSGPSPSEMLKTLQINESKLEKAFAQRKLLHCNFDTMTGHQFENFCAVLLRKNGYTDVTVTQGSGDQGIDIIAVKDGVRYGIQCKCYSSNVGNKAVQEAYTGARFYDCLVGVVLTNRDFTKAAKELAYKNGVLLWNREYLNKLISNI